MPLWMWLVALVIIGTIVWARGDARRKAVAQRGAELGTQSQFRWGSNIRADPAIELRIDTKGSPEEAREATRRAADQLGATKAKVAIRKGDAIVTINEGLISTTHPDSPVVRISYQGSDTGTSVHARIDSYKTRQEKIFGIPVGPLQLLSQGTYKLLLASLQQELQALKPQWS